MSEGISGNGFTTKDIVLMLDAKVTKRFDDIEELITVNHTDHEIRLRALEKFGWQFKALAGTVVLLASTVGSLAWHLWG